MVGKSGRLGLGCPGWLTVKIAWAAQGERNGFGTSRVHRIIMSGWVGTFYGRDGRDCWDGRRYVYIISTLGMVAKSFVFLQTPSKNEQNQKTKKHAKNSEDMSLRARCLPPSELAILTNKCKGVDSAIGRSLPWKPASSRSASLSWVFSSST